ncbi:MAG: tetratricopeptide repeat protein, partial [Bacteroidota bacterium]
MSLLLFFCLLLSHDIAAKKIIDSLERVLENNLTLDSNRVDLLNRLGFEYWIVDPNQSEKFGRQALELSKILNYQDGVAYASRVVGVAHWVRGNYEPALEFLFRSQQNYQEVDDLLGEANATMNIGLVYADQANYDRALNYYNAALELFGLLDEQGRIATTFTKIGIVHANQRKHDAAYDYFSRALAIHEAQGFQYGIAEVNRELGQLFLDTGDPDKSLSYLFRALEASETRN